MIEYTDAQDELFASVNIAFAQAGAGLTPLPTIVWPGQAVPTPDAGVIYAKPFFEVVTRQQATLLRVNGLSVFENTALFTLQIFAPQQLANGLDNAMMLGIAVRKVVSKASPSGDLWYRNARATPVPSVVGMNQVNVVVQVVFNSEE